MDAVRLARAFGLEGAARLSDGPVARGREGVVWRLDTDDGRWAAKVTHRPATEADVRAPTELQELASAAGVPTPAVRRSTDGTVFAAVDGRQVRLYEWVDLLPPDPGLDPALVGATVAAAHRAAAPLDGGTVDPWHCEPVGAERWDALIEELATAEAPFAHRLADLRDELVALESWIEPAEALRWCHCDLWADNLLPTAAGGVCVLDWDNSGPADPSQELAYVLLEFGRTDAGRARALVSAYDEAGGPGSVRHHGHFSMLIAQLGHITEIAARDWLTPNPRTPDREDAVAWISEVFDDPHTRDALDRLLAAVT